MIRGKEYTSRLSYSISTNNPKLAYILNKSKIDKRKPKNKFYINQKNRILIPISKITKKSYDGFVYNVETSDHTYLINNIITHNCDRAHTHELAAPVRDRGGEVELTPPSSEAWIDWAVDNDIDSKIIGFLSWKPSNLHSVDFDDNQKFTTERGWERLNTLLNGITDYKTMELVSGTAIGEGVAREYVAFCKIKDSISLDEVLKNPQALKQVEEISVKYFLTTAIGENYKKGKVKFEDVMKISEVYDEMGNVEFVALMWRLCIRYAPTKFKKDFTTKELDHPLREKFAKYLTS